MLTFHKMIRHKDFPIIVILLIGLIVGLCIFRDFGISWDEPEYYQYADSTIKAYSISDLFSGKYDLNNSLGPSDLRYYGPAFLIFGKGLNTLLHLLFPKVLIIDFWHLIINLSFLLGIYLFYKLTQRWTNTISASIASLLMMSQPVIFGNSWIDPKDIPFFVFFIGAIYYGIQFSDRAVLFFEGYKVENIRNNLQLNPWLNFKGVWHKLFFVFGLAIASFSMFFQIWSKPIREAIASKISTIDINIPVTALEKLFVRFVRSEGQVPISYYANKSSLLYDRYTFYFLFFTLLYWVIFLYFHRYPQSCSQIIESIFKPVFGYFRLLHKQTKKKLFLFSFFIACFFLALTCATRVIGPVAGLLIIFVWIVKLKKKSIPFIFFYGIFSFLFFYLLWPYIWQDTYKNLMFVIQHMSNNPTGVNVLFNGNVFDSRALPMSYFPTLLGITLTEPALLLVLFGFVIYVYKLIKHKFHNLEVLIIFAWFFIPLIYILLTKPPMYDNYRHFLFTLPALFLFAAFGIQWFFTKIKKKWMNVLISVVILFPGIFAIIQLHPYEYSYYNSIVGGVKGAAYKYEIDYWITCYKALTNEVQDNEKDTIDIFVDLTPDLVINYKLPNATIHSINVDSFPEGSFIFLPMRWDHLLLYDQYPFKYEIKIDGVTLCAARQVN